MFEQDSLQKCKGGLQLDKSINFRKAHQYIKGKSQLRIKGTFITYQNLSHKSQQYRTLHVFLGQKQKKKSTISDTSLVLKVLPDASG